MSVTIDHSPGRELSINGRTYLYFGGTSYLGISTNRDFLNIYREELDKYSPSYGASREGNIKLAIYRKTEEYLMQWLGIPDALLLSSGYLAGQLCVQHFSSPKYRIFISPICHSALLPQNARPFTSFQQMKASLSELLNAGKHSPQPVIFTDSLNFSADDVDIISELKQIPLQECVLVVDDSHGIGVFGKDGKESFDSFTSLNAKEVLFTTSMGKALGIGAGAISGDVERLRALRGSPLYAGASPPSPTALATFLRASNIYAASRQKLFRFIERVKTALASSPYLRFAGVHPSIGCVSPELIDHLEDKGILISNFKYSGDRNSLPGRIVLSAGHNEEDIEMLIASIKQF